MLSIYGSAASGVDAPGPLMVDAPGPPWGAERAETIPDMITGGNTL